MAFDAWPIETIAYSGQELRMGTVLPYCVGDGTGLGARSSVRSSGGGTDLRVQQQSSPNMTVKVSPAVAVIQGAASSLQGPYTYALDAVTNLTISAAHASLSRTDRICVRIRDSTFDTSGQKDSGLIVITGTPGAGTPSVPTDATYYTLALIIVTAAKTSILTADISDQRLFFAAAGGTILASSTVRPTSPTIGQQIYESDTKLFLFWNGSAWVANAVQQIAQQVLGSTTASVTFSSIPAYFSSLRMQISARSTASVIWEQVNLRFNGDSGTNYHSLGFWANQSTGTSGTVTYGQNTAQTSTNIGDIYGASAGVSTVTGGITADIAHYANTSWTKNITAQFSAVNGTNFSGGERHSGWASTSAITSITLFPATGSFATNSTFTLLGVP